MHSIQLQDEIDAHFGNGEEVDNLEAIQSLEYLEQVILESSRRYTVTPILFRHCTRDYLLPGTDIRIRKGWEVHLFPPGIHMDPDIYPDPEEFDPSRFTREARAARHPMAFQAFGMGQRNCVGKAFALLELKVALIRLLRRFSFKRCPRGRSPSQVALDPLTALAHAGNVLWVAAEERENRFGRH